MATPKTYGLTHLAIAVRDLNRTSEFYQKVFDMIEMYHEKDFVQLTTPGCNDILVFEKTKSRKVKNGGIAHFGFRLKKAEDIEIVYSKVLEAGGVVVDKGEFLRGSPYMFFKDPDGYTVEVWYELLPSPR